MYRLLLGVALLFITACATDADPSGSPESVASETVAAEPTPAALTADSAAVGAPAVGDQAPAFSLPTADGAEVSLTDLNADGPVVVTFYRGSWCPYCNTQLQDYARRYDAIRQAGGSLVAISPQGADGTAAMSDSLTATSGALPFPVLSDVGNVVSRRFGLVFEVEETTRERYRAVGIDLAVANEDGRWELPVPATYVIDRGGTIRAAFVEADYTQRASLDDIVAALRALGS